MLTAIISGNLTGHILFRLNNLAVIYKLADYLRGRRTSAIPSIVRSLPNYNESISFDKGHTYIVGLKWLKCGRGTRGRDDDGRTGDCMIRFQAYG
jgi:hypothetical protein